MPSKFFNIIIFSAISLAALSACFSIFSLYKNISINRYVYDATLINSEIEQSVNLDEVYTILKGTMNSVSKIESGGPTTIDLIGPHIKNNGGLLCDGMSVLLNANLKREGIPSRIITMRRDLRLIGDTHVSVEVPYQGRWIIVDPTFHTTFKHNGELLGAYEMRRLIEKGESIIPEFLGEVQYPARLTNYYIDFRPLMDNILVPMRAPSQWAKIPPFTYFTGTKLKYMADHEHLINLYENANRELFFYTFVMPIAVAFLFFVWVGVLLYLRYSKKIRTNPSL